ncbi:MAG: fumarylacetoacetate hydrolase family protein, partial [Asticcacaulis sp.]
VQDGMQIPYPLATDDLHHEVELVLALGDSLPPEGASHLDLKSADAAIWGWAVGLDLTRRDLQARAKAAGQPWDAAKGFDQSAPCGTITRRSDLETVSGAIRLWVGDDLRQSAHLADMIWSPAQIVAEASKLWRLAPGDLIYTGTPEGVGAVARGQTLKASIDGLSPLTVDVI